MSKKVLSIIGTFVFGSIGIFCTIYYFSKFYIQGSLTFEHDMIVGFSIIATMIVVSLILGMVLYVKLCIIEQQNVSLSNQVSCLSKELEKFHYSEMDSIKDNMECILDLDEGRK